MARSIYLYPSFLCAFASLADVALAKSALREFLVSFASGVRSYVFEAPKKALAEVGGLLNCEPQWPC
jgi:hypothetical protein